MKAVYILLVASVAMFTMLLVAEHTIQRQNAAIEAQWLADNWNKY